MFPLTVGIPVCASMSALNFDQVLLFYFLRKYRVAKMIVHFGIVFPLFEFFCVVLARSACVCVRLSRCGVCGCIVHFLCCFETMVNKMSSLFIFFETLIWYIYRVIFKCQPWSFPRRNQRNVQSSTYGSLMYFD